MPKRAAQPKTEASTMDFETTLNQLETIVTKLESGEMPLEESLKEFEKGIHLAKLGQKTLRQAEQRIQILLQKNENADLEDYQPNE